VRLIAVSSQFTPRQNYFYKSCSGILTDEIDRYKETKLDLNELTEYGFYVLLSASIVTSLYLWFVKKQRDGRLLKISYAVRVACGLFFSATIPYVFVVLRDAFPYSAIALFAIPFVVITLVLVMPWGMIVRKVFSKTQTV
jgi:hypothetical protein